jgi:hypothetical protein
MLPTAVIERSSALVLPYSKPRRNDYLLLQVYHDTLLSVKFVSALVNAILRECPGSDGQGSLKPTSLPGREMNE